MYVIIEKNKVISVCDTPAYVKKRNGIWFSCAAEGADGIVINNEIHEDAIAAKIENKDYVFTSDSTDKSEDEDDDSEGSSKDKANPPDPIDKKLINDIQDAICQLSREVAKITQN